MSAPGLSHVVRLDRLPSGPVAITATAEECAALARRFDLPEVSELAAEIRLTPVGEAVQARGRLRARYRQLCAVAAAPFPVTMDEALNLRFVPAIAPASEDDALEFDPDDPDEVEYDGATINLGAAIADSFGLALDPYATGPDAAAVRAEAGLLPEDTPTGPFAALAGLRPKG